MKTRVALLAVVLIVLTAALAGAAKAPNTFTFGGVSATGAVYDIHTDDATGQIDRFVISGKAHIEAEDKATHAALSVDAAKITVQLFTKPKQGAQGTGLVKSGTFAGPVKMVYTVVTNGVTTKTTATADNADFDGTANQAHLVGNVKIINENPALDAAPAVMSGDKATFNLTRNLGPDVSRFSFEGSPAAITVTPKPKPNGTE